MPRMARDLLTDTAVDSLGDGRYRADVPADWSAAIFIFGGVPITVGMRAAQAELDDDAYEIRSLNAVFCQPFHAGGIEAQVEVLRAGKRARQVSVDVSNSGADSSPGMRMTATYGLDDDHYMRFTELDFPDVPMPDDPGVEVIRPDAEAPIPVIRQMEMISLSGKSPFDPEKGPARTERWVRFREPVGADLPSLAVHADELGLAVMQQRGADDPFAFVISLDIGIHFIDRPTTEWILLDSIATDAGRGFASGIVNLWDAEQNLVAVATQRALLKGAPADVAERVDQYNRRDR